MTAELDPTGKDQHEPGAKVDAGKIEVSLIIDGMPRALWAIAEVATFGANKYTRNGWQSVDDAQYRYRNAELRHALYTAMGEEIDPDSELLHLAHKAWNSLAVLELYLRGKENE